MDVVLREAGRRLVVPHDEVAVLDGKARTLSPDLVEGLVVLNALRSEHCSGSVDEDLHRAADDSERERDVRLRAGSDVHCRGVQATVFTHGDAHRGKPGVEQVDVVVGEACRGLVEPVDEARA